MVLDVSRARHYPWYAREQFRLAVGRPLLRERFGRDSRDQRPRCLRVPPHRRERGDPRREGPDPRLGLLGDRPETDRSRARERPEGADRSRQTRPDEDSERLLGHSREDLEPRRRDRLLGRAAADRRALSHPAGRAGRVHELEHRGGGQRPFEAGESLRAQFRKAARGLRGADDPVRKACALRGVLPVELHRGARESDLPPARLHRPRRADPAGPDPAPAGLAARAPGAARSARAHGAAPARGGRLGPRAAPDRGGPARRGRAGSRRRVLFPGSRVQHRSARSRSCAGGSRFRNAPGDPRAAEPAGRDLSARAPPPGPRARAPGPAHPVYETRAGDALRDGRSGRARARGRGALLPRHSGSATKRDEACGGEARGRRGRAHERTRRADRARRRPRVRSARRRRTGTSACGSCATWRGRPGET